MVKSNNYLPLKKYLYLNKTRLLALIYISLMVTIIFIFAEKKRRYFYDFYRYLNYRTQGTIQRGDGGKATEVKLFDPMGLIEDRQGNVYIVDRGRGDLQGPVIWKVDIQGKINAIAGTGKIGKKGVIPANPMALKTDLISPENLALDSANRLYFVDHVASIIWRIEENGELTHIAGTGERGFSGDGGSALKATFNKPYDIKFDSQDNLYIADTLNHRIRKINPEGIITTVIGTGKRGYSGDGALAIDAQLNTPYNIFIDSQDRLLIADSYNHVIRQVDQNGIITTIAGVGQAGYAGDGGTALSAKFDTPQALFIDNSNQLFVGDEHNNAIRIISSDGNISTLIGTGTLGFALDGISSEHASLNDPETVIVRRNNSSILIADADNGRILMIGQDGLLSTFAGRDWQCQSDDYKKLQKFGGHKASDLKCKP